MSDGDRAQVADERIAQWVYVAAAHARLAVEYPHMIRAAPGFTHRMALDYADDPAFRAAMEIAYRNGRTALFQTVIAYRYTSPHDGKVQHFHPADITLILASPGPEPADYDPDEMRAWMTAGAGADLAGQPEVGDAPVELLPMAEEPLTAQPHQDPRSA